MQQQHSQLAAAGSGGASASPAAGAAGAAGLGERPQRHDPYDLLLGRYTAMGFARDEVAMALAIVGPAASDQPEKIGALGAACGAGHTRGQMRVHRFRGCPPGRAAAHMPSCTRRRRLGPPLPRPGTASLQWMPAASTSPC